MQFKKIFRVTFGAVLILVGLYVLSSFIFIESYFSAQPYIDTKFAPGFSWDRYNRISKGATEQEVRDTLGEPFTTFLALGGNLEIKSGEVESDGWNHVIGPCWQYSDDGAFIFHDFAWIGVNVCFGAEGVKNKNEVIFYD